MFSDKINVRTRSFPSDKPKSSCLYELSQEPYNKYTPCFQNHIYPVCTFFKNMSSPIKNRWFILFFSLKIRNFLTLEVTEDR